MADDARTLTELKARYGVPPDDLTIEMRGSKAILRSGTMTVETIIPFGVIAWDEVLMRYVLPALAQFTRVNRG